MRTQKKIKIKLRKKNEEWYTNSETIRLIPSTMRLSANPKREEVSSVVH